MQMGIRGPGHARCANPLTLVIAGDHSGPLKPLLSLDSSGVRDVRVAGSNPVIPTKPSEGRWLPQMTCHELRYHQAHAAPVSPAHAFARARSNSLSRTFCARAAARPNSW